MLVVFYHNKKVAKEQIKAGVESGKTTGLAPRTFLTQRAGRDVDSYTARKGRSELASVPACFTLDWDTGRSCLKPHEFDLKARSVLAKDKA